MPSKWAARTLNELVIIGETVDEAKYDAIAAALDEARDSILSRLRNPDEAMLRIVNHDARYMLRGILRALADVLAATPPEATEE